MISSLPFGFQDLIGVLTSVVLIPEGGSGKQRRRKDARWVLPFCTPVDAPAWSPAPGGSLTRSEQLQKVHFTSSDASIPDSLNLRGAKIRVSSEVGQRGGLSPTSPGSRSSGAGRSGRRSEAPGSGLGDSCAALTGRLARRASASQVPAPSRPPPTPQPLLLPHGSVRERNFLLGRPLRSPGVCGGRERRPPPPAPPPPGGRRS